MLFLLLMNLQFAITVCHIGNKIFHCRHYGNGWKKEKRTKKKEKRPKQKRKEERPNQKRKGDTKTKIERKKTKKNEEKKRNKDKSKKIKRPKKPTPHQCPPLPSLPSLPPFPSPSSPPTTTYMREEVEEVHPVLVEGEDVVRPLLGLRHPLHREEGRPEQRPRLKDFWKENKQISK